MVGKRRRDKREAFQTVKLMSFPQSWKTRLGRQSQRRKEGRKEGKKENLEELY
jgi:hypothetical protein